MLCLWTTPNFSLAHAVIMNKNANIMEFMNLRHFFLLDKDSPFSYWNFKLLTKTMVRVYCAKVASDEIIKHGNYELR